MCRCRSEFKVAGGVQHAAGFATVIGGAYVSGYCHIARTRITETVAVFVYGGMAPCRSGWHVVLVDGAARGSYVCPAVRAGWTGDGGRHVVGAVSVTCRCPDGQLAPTWCRVVSIYGASRRGRPAGLGDADVDVDGLASRHVIRVVHVMVLKGRVRRRPRRHQGGRVERRHGPPAGGAAVWPGRPVSRAAARADTGSRTGPGGPSPSLASFTVCRCRPSPAAPRPRAAAARRAPPAARRCAPARPRPPPARAAPRLIALLLGFLWTRSSRPSSRCPRRLHAP